MVSTLFVWPVTWLFKFYILATSKVISRQIPTCDSALHTHGDFIVLPPLADQAATNLYFTLYRDSANQLLPNPSNAECQSGSDKYQFSKSLVVRHITKG